MTLEALGNLGEAVGAVAVVISLVYLIAQVRQNTRSIRSATYQSVVATAAACNQSLSQSRELARILRLGSLEAARLDPDERVQFSFLCMQFFDIFENLFLQHEHGTIDDDYWLPRRDAFLTLFETPGIVDRWLECRGNYSKRFCEMVEAGLADESRTAPGVRFLFDAGRADGPASRREVGLGSRPPNDLTSPQADDLVSSQADDLVSSKADDLVSSKADEAGPPEERRA